MTPLSVETRRRLLLTAEPDSPLARRYPTLVSKGRDIVRNRWTHVTDLCLACNDSAGDTEARTGIGNITMIKPVGDHCNLRCRYCNTRSLSSETPRMPFDLLERIVRETLPRASRAPDFIFHGGEPLMAGLDFFRDAMHLQATYRRPDQTVRNHVQTNATLVTREWAAFLAEHDFFVGVSLDGPESEHDRFRVDSAGRGSHARVMQSVALLQEAGVKLQAIAVVPPSPETPPAALFAFMQSAGIPNWRVNHCRAVEAVSTYPAYMESLLSSWMAAPDSVDIAILSETLEGLLGYPLRTCWMNGSCRKFVGFEPDGTVSPCCQMPVPPAFAYGNLRDQTLPELLSSPAAQRFDQALSNGQLACTNCEWRHLCGGGCAYTRLQIAGALMEPDPLCVLYQDVFRRLTRSIDAALDEAGAGSESGRAEKHNGVMPMGY